MAGRVLGIMASILVTRHLKTTEDLFNNRASPRPPGAERAVAQRWQKVGMPVTRKGRVQCDCGKRYENRGAFDSSSWPMGVGGGTMFRLVEPVSPPAHSL